MGEIGGHTLLRITMVLSIALALLGTVIETRAAEAGTPGFPVAGLGTELGTRAEATGPEARRPLGLSPGDLLIPVEPTPRAEAQRGVVPDAAPAPAFEDTSRYLMGNVAVATIFLESDGSVDVNQENWTSMEIGTVMTEIQEALDWWEIQESDAFLSFVHDPASPYVLNTSYEPINHPLTDEGLWVNEAMVALGYPSGSFLTRVRTFDNDLRAALSTDWAFTIFVVDSSVDADGEFTNSRSGYGYLEGPSMGLTYDNDGWGIARMDNVTAHEIGHVFAATDEYDQGPTSGLDPGWDDEVGGYLNVQEEYLSGCLMDTADLACISGSLSAGSSGTMGQIGWRDSDGDGVMDILDVPPETVLDSLSLTNDVTPTYTGTATAVAYPSPSGTDVTINEIADVEYRVDGGPWMSATATDGGFDGPVEAFAFTTAALTEGDHTVEARAKIVVPTPSPTTLYDASPALEPLAIDLTPPTSSVDPLSPYATSSSFVVNASAADAQGVVSVELFFRVNGGSWMPYGVDLAAPWSWNVNIGTTGGDGIYEFYTVAADLASNVEAAPASPDATTMVDTTPPTTSATLSGTEGNGGWYLGPVTVDLTFVDATSGVIRTFYRVDGAEWRVLQATFFRVFTVEAEGTHTVEHYSEDRAGNAETIRTIQVRIDLTPPSVGLHLPATVALVAEPSIVIAWSVEDNASGVSGCTVVLDGGDAIDVGTATTHGFVNLPDGRHNVHVACVDAAGRTGEETVDFTSILLHPSRLFTTSIGSSWLQLAVLVFAVLLVLFLLLRRRRRRKQRHEGPSPPS